MFKKLALSARFLPLALFVLLSFSGYSNEIEVEADPGYKSVAQTGLTVPTQPAQQPALPPPTLLAPPDQIDIPTPTPPLPQPAPTQAPAVAMEAPAANLGRFDLFVETVVDGQPGVLRGVYVEDVLALRVVQQPADDPLFVPEERGVAAQFQSAAKNGVTGILAHNYLSGKLFFQLALGQQVQLIYGDGEVARYTITDMQYFQKLQPKNPSSRYIDLSTGIEQSTEQVINRVYSSKGQVTFQTCIRKGEEWSWGLLFVMATPTE